MSDRLQGKVIIVAGAGGIGNELARRYASEGASVVLADIDGALARTVAEEIVAAGGTAIATDMDGTDDESIRAAVDLAVTAFGGLDGFHANFVNYLDNHTVSDVLGLQMEVYDEVMRVNVRGRLLCTRQAVPAMIARGGGSILYTSSGAAFIPMPTRVAYAMSKAANHALMRHVAIRFGPDGIRANVVSLGVIRHARFEASVSADKANRLKARSAVERFGTPADAAAMSTLLMSDDGAYITGQVIAIDGGASMRQ